MAVSEDPMTKIKGRPVSEEPSTSSIRKSAPSAAKPRRNRVQSVIHRHRDNVAKQIKICNRFERQKLSRRRNDQREDPQKVAKVDAEVAACNSLDADELADRHLRKTFAKIRSIHESIELPQEWRARTQEALEPALANVSARLYSHKLVKAAMTKCVDEVKMVIARQEAQTLNAEVGGVRAKTGPEESAGDSDSESESGAGEMSSEDPKASSRKRKMTDPAGESSSEQFSKDEDEQPRQKKIRVQAPARLISNSTFVPSLTAVGYAVNSDSDASDLDEEVAPRKNRRGQKARQAIWEKKYKEKAKHLQQQQQQQRQNKASRGSKTQRGDDEWDARRGAIASTGPGAARTAQPAPLARTTVVENGTTVHVIGEQRVREKTAVLHPSWAAKKQMKAKEKAMDQYAGKKITF